MKRGEKKGGGGKRAGRGGKGNRHTSALKENKSLVRRAAEKQTGFGKMGEEGGPESEEG